jgi:hypothetical protein
VKLPLPNLGNVVVHTFHDDEWVGCDVVVTFTEPYDDSELKREIANHVRAWNSRNPGTRIDYGLLWPPEREMLTHLVDHIVVSHEWITFLQDQKGPLTQAELVGYDLYPNQAILSAYAPNGIRRKPCCGRGRPPRLQSHTNNNKDEPEDLDLQDIEWDELEEMDAQEAT